MRWSIGPCVTGHQAEATRIGPCRVESVPVPTISTRSRVLGLALVLCLAGPLPGTSPLGPPRARWPRGATVAEQAADPSPAACAPRPIARTWTRTMLTAVTRAGSQAWAVGMTASGPESPRSPIALAMRDGTWTRMPIARRSGEHALFGIDRSSSGRLWSVGYRQTSAGYRPLLLAWQAGRWQPRSLGAVGTRGGALVDIRARTDAATFAVGYSVGAAGQRSAGRPTHLERVASRPPAHRRGHDGCPAGHRLRARRPTHGRWAGVPSSGTPQPWVVRWDGARWRSVPAIRSGSEGVLTSVAVGDAGRGVGRGLPHRGRPVSPDGAAMGRPRMAGGPVPDGGRDRGRASEHPGARGRSARRGWDALGRRGRTMAGVPRVAHDARLAAG